MQLGTTGGDWLARSSQRYVDLPHCSSLILFLPLLSFHVFLASSFVRSCSVDRLLSEPLETRDLRFPSRELGEGGDDI